MARSPLEAAAARRDELCASQPPAARSSERGRLEGCRRRLAELNNLQEVTLTTTTKANPNPNPITPTPTVTLTVTGTVQGLTETAQLDAAAAEAPKATTARMARDSKLLQARSRPARTY